MVERELKRRERRSGSTCARFVPLAGNERVLDSGAGTGALALALGPLVARVVALDVVPELLVLGRQQAAAARPRPNVVFVEGDATALPFERDAFDLAACHRTLHHVARPELVISELARVTRIGGRVLVIDQIAPGRPARGDRARPLRARSRPARTRGCSRTPTSGRCSTPTGSSCARSRQEQEARDLDSYLDLAGCDGDERETAASVAPSQLVATIGWYLAAKPLP